MHKLRKAAAVAVMVGGIGLVGGGVAHADGGRGYDDPYPHGIFIDNLQEVDCDQTFDGGSVLIDTSSETGTGGAISGDTEIAQGNFCTVVGG